MDNESNQDGAQTALASPPNEDSEKNEQMLITNQSVQKIGEVGHVDEDGQDEGREDGQFGGTEGSS